MPTLERVTMYTMLSGQSCNNLAIRFGLPALIYFMQLEFAWSGAEAARILGAFFPGYILTQVPSGWFAQKYGGKGILTLNMVGNAALLCAVPAAAAAGQGFLMATFCAMGLFQGPLIPAQGAIKAEWLKGLGGERAFALRLMGLGTKVAATLTSWAVPFIATRLGWRAVAYVYGGCTAGFALLWHLLASNAPRSSLAAPPGAQSKLVIDRDGRPVSPAKPAPDGSQQKPKQKVAEWGVLRVRAAQATVWGHIVDNFMTYMMNQMGPIIFTEVCGVSTAAMGAFLAIPPTLNCVGSFAIAGIEALMLKSGMTQLRIQKLMTTLGSIIEAVSLVAFGKCRTPVPATIAWCGVVVGHLLHGSGFFTNYEDVGGPDSAILWSVGNPLASLPGYLSPMIAAAIKAATGKYDMLFNIAAVGQLSIAVFFGLCGSCVPARNILARTRAERKKKQEAVGRGGESSN